jgi:hypothetical protein
MRRLFAVTALATAFFAAGCGNSPESENSGSGSGASAPAATTAADNTANTKEVCASAEKVATEGITALFTEMGKMIAAAGANKEADAEKAKTAAEDAVKKLSTDLQAEAGKAADPKLKEALENMAKAFQTMAVDVEKIDEAKMEAAGTELEKLCG